MILFYWKKKNYIKKKDYVIKQTKNKKIDKKGFYSSIISEKCLLISIENKQT